MNQPWTRRAFLQRTITMISATSTLPLFLHRSAFAIDNPFEYRQTHSLPGVPDDRILVVIQLGGGNDGLNTLIPHADHAYYDARPQLAVPQNQVLKFTERNVDHLGLHPALGPLKELYDEGVLAVYQGVGYPNPNRSHFKSMDIWHTANPEGDGQGNGWIGRYFDNACAGEPEPQPNQCVCLGDSAPLAAQGDTLQPVAFEDAQLFRWAGEQLHPDLARAYDQINRAGVSTGVDDDAPAAFLMRTALDAQLSSDQIRKAVAVQPVVAYPPTRLGQSLRMIGSMIRAGMNTRVYYTDHSGFDTHAAQFNQHQNLLTEFAAALHAFHADLKAQGNHRRVMVMSFSEFGRRVKQNASGGTDHGTAAPLFIMGDMVQPGVHGKHPSLTKLDDSGDLIHSVDFRQVYAAILEQWMAADSAAVLGRKFTPVSLVRKT